MAVIGIDLGTTNSLAVAYLDSNYVLIPNTFGEYLTPSIVSIDDDESIVVGKIAKQYLVTHPEATTSLFKRNMGLQTNVYLKGKAFLPEELSACIVKQLIKDAEDFLQTKVDEVIISVPAYFNENQRAATKRIGAILGIKVERLINEPSAAALACHEHTREDEVLIVFDFGGGTLDVSVVDCFDNVVSICAIAGNNQLGGTEFDNLIMQAFCEENHINIDSLSNKQRESLRSRCEKAKICLQEQEHTVISMFINDTDYAYTLSNAVLYDISAEIFAQLKKVIAEAVNASGFRKEEIDNMVLVGGSCHMPIVQTYLHGLMDLEIYNMVDMDQIVVNGLGTYLGIKQRKDHVKDLVLTDICPFSLSMATYERSISHLISTVMIKRNSVLPCSITKTFWAIEKGQKYISIEAYQGECFYAKDNNLLHEFNVDIPKNYREHESIEVTFSYDINSLLCIEVLVVSTQKKVHVFIGDHENQVANLNKIKNLSLKLQFEPQKRLIHEQINRLLEENGAKKQEFIRSLYANYLEQLECYENNIHRKQQLIEDMSKVINTLDYENKNSSFFQFGDDDLDSRNLS